MVKVDGMDALCTDLNCDFAYQESTSVIEGATLDEAAFDEVIITGQNLPDDIDDVIYFGPTRCTQMLNDGTSITCTLDDTRVTGNWIADILTN